MNPAHEFLQPADPLVLGIETSCDETATALYQPSRGLITHHVRSQNSTHRPYRGVVPELASRDHIGTLLPLVEQTLAGVRPDAVACTAGPGLAGCLAVGVSLAQALAFSWRIPLAAVHHLEGHLLSPFLDPPAGFDFPYLALLASGGHTALYDVAAFGRYRLLGQTLDDAAGEGFDKTAALLDLPYPGAAHLEELAQRGDPARVRLPVPMLRHPGCDFSFSGLKTAARRALAAGSDRADVAASFQHAAVQILSAKTARALRLTKRKWLTAVGGVCRNSALRTALQQTANAHDAQLALPALEFCVDNAAMIALAGWRRLGSSYDMQVRPRWPLAEAIS